MSQGMIDTQMTDALGRFLDVDVARYKLIGANMANLDTPGYRTRDLDFRAELERAGRSAPQEDWADSAETFAGDSAFGSFTSLSRSPGPLTSGPLSPPSRPVRGLMERPDGNNVSVERESLLLAEVQMRYNLGVQLLKDQFHQISTAINSGGASS
jgi:flagellar basal-body rod protein FlgB